MSGVKTRPGRCRAPDSDMSGVETRPGRSAGRTDSDMSGVETRPGRCRAPDSDMSGVETRPGLQQQSGLAHPAPWSGVALIYIIYT
jgi:hypothetical protein